MLVRKFSRDTFIHNQALSKVMGLNKSNFLYVEGDSCQKCRECLFFEFGLKMWHKIRKYEIAGGYSLIVLFLLKISVSDRPSYEVYQLKFSRL